MITVKENPTLRALKEVNKIPAAIKTIKDAGVTKTALAEYLGVSRETLWQWENSRYHPPKVLADVILYLAESAEQQSQQQH